MQSRMSHVFSSKLLRKYSSLGSVPSFSLAHFSTIPNKPMRGGDGRRRRDDASERDFLQDLNFGDQRGRDDDENRHQSRPLRSPNRPMRGGGGDRGGGDQRPMSHNQKFRARNEEIIDRGKEKDRSVDDLFEDLNFGDMGNRKRTEQADPSDGSFKVSDGEKEKSQSGDALFEKLNFGEKTDDRVKEMDRTGDTLLKKLNLGDKRAKETHTPADPEPEKPPEAADEIFKKMKETSLIPNAVAMLDGLCKDGLVQDAMKLFGLMREKGTIPEVVIYTAVVEGFCKAAKFEDAKRIFRKMQKNEIVPNAFSYGVVIQGFCKGKRLDDAVEFCMEMIEAGHSPNAATLTGLVNEFCKEKGVEEAEGFLKSVKEKGFAIDEKAVREYLDKKGPYTPMVWEAIFGKKNTRRPF